MADRAMLRCSFCKQYTVQVVHERRNGGGGGGGRKRVGR